MDLTPKQRSVLDFLREYRAHNAQPPSYEEIREHFGFSSLNSVRKHLQQLERKGFIRSPWGNQKRALELVETDPPAGAVSLPLLGFVAAGTPIEAPEIPESVEIPETLLRHGEHYALKVRGDSMIDDGIHDGDVLVVQRRERAEPGQTVVALVEGEATVKRYYRQGHQVELRPANPSYQPILADEEDVRLRGIVVGLLRRFH